MGKKKLGGVGGTFFLMFSRKTFVFPRETLRSLAKLLCSLAKPVEFGQTLPVYFTASNLVVHTRSQWRDLWSFILNVDSC